MRILALLAVLLSGCASTKVEEVRSLATQSSAAEDLDRIWDTEVDDALAGFTAIRPRLTSVESQVLSLYDAQLKGLEALAGKPTLDAVGLKAELLGPNGKDAIAKLRAEKEALDRKTTELEVKASKAELERIAAEARADAAAEQAMRAEAATNLSRVAVIAIGAGIIAFLFGHFIGIPRWSAAATVGLGLLVATTAPQLLVFFGSESAQNIMAATFSVLGLGTGICLGLWAWRKIFGKEKSDEPVV